MNLPKRQQRPDNEDRALKYRQWRRDVGGGCYVADIDHFEYRVVDGEVVPVAVFELTLVKQSGETVPDSYLDAIVRRFSTDGQAQAIKTVAQRLSVKAWIILFNETISSFWVYDLSSGRGWWQLDELKYTAWLRRLGTKK